MEGSDQWQDDSGPLLILGLPNDIALMCLARVPRKYHPVLKCVSKGWRELVCGEMWVSHRRNHNLDETWIYALCRDSFNHQLCCFVLDPNNNVLSPKRWKKIPDLPTCVMNRQGMGFEAIGKRVYLLGGCNSGRSIRDPTDEVYCYDAATNAWSKSTSLSVPRCYFLSEVVDDDIYAIGGLVDSETEDAICWDMYNPRTNKWIKKSHINNIGGGGGGSCLSLLNKGNLNHMSSMVFKGKIYLRCSNYIWPAAVATGSHVMMIVYDPLHKTWYQEEKEDDMAGGWLGPTVVIDGTLYVLDQSGCGGTKVVMWKEEEEEEAREWIPVGRLSPLLAQPPCQLVAIGTDMFIVGKGLGTVILDIEKAKRTKGVIVASSIPRPCNYDLDVISCKCVTI